MWGETADIQSAVSRSISNTGILYQVNLLCSITVDAETGLMRAFTFAIKSETMEQTSVAEVNYNVDQEPDYSLKY